MSLGEKVRFFRVMKKISTMKLAKLAGLTQASVCRIENGQSLPKISTVLKIAEALEVPASEFLVNENPEIKPEKFMDLFGVLRPEDRKQIIDLMVEKLKRHQPMADALFKQNGRTAGI